VPEDETADAPERHCAELAARRGRQSSKDAPAPEQADILAHQSRADLFCGQAFVRHAPNLTRAAIALLAGSSGCVRVSVS
jgi:hypothetical protein